MDNGTFARAQIRSLTTPHRIQEWSSTHPGQKDLETTRIICECGKVFAHEGVTRESTNEQWEKHFVAWEEEQAKPTSTIPTSIAVAILQRFLGFETEDVNGLWGPKTEDAVCGLKGCTRRCIELIGNLDKPTAEKVAAKLNPEDIRGGISDGFLDVLLTMGNPMDKVMAAEIIRLRKRIDLPRELPVDIARVGAEAYDAAGESDTIWDVADCMRHAWAAILAHLSGAEFVVDGITHRKFVEEEPVAMKYDIVDGPLFQRDGSGYRSVGFYAGNALTLSAKIVEPSPSETLRPEETAPEKDKPAPEDDPNYLIGRDEFMLATRAGTAMSYLSITPQGRILRTLDRNKARLFANKEVAQSFADALAFVLTDPSYTPVPARS